MSNRDGVLYLLVGVGCPLAVRYGRQLTYCITSILLATLIASGTVRIDHHNNDGCCVPN